MNRASVGNLKLIAVVAVCIMQFIGVGFAIAQEPSPVPTYDPLVEPPLPSNPTAYELGHNLYWLWCMTCHGDRGQGLTDDWRAVWEEDHQNCWARGCHAGDNVDQVFIIPTVVPLIIGEAHLDQFTSLQELANYLMVTHPPQHPGVLTEDQYHAIAVYVFSQNDRSLIEETPTPTWTPTSIASATFVLTTTPIPALKDEQPDFVPFRWIGMILALCTLVIAVGLLVKYQVNHK